MKKIGKFLEVLGVAGVFVITPITCMSSVDQASGPDEALAGFWLGLVLFLVFLLTFGAGRFFRSMGD